MNRSDIKLILIVLVVLAIVFLYLNTLNSSGNYAVVYYENEIIKKIDLSIDSEYIVKGFNGDVVISVKSNSIAVIEEDSPKHLCSLQGYVNSSLQPIICLPNKIVIKIEGLAEEVDTVVR
jgi:hypothetical protein